MVETKKLSQDKVSQEDVEASFRESLRDVAAVIKGLSYLCRTPEEMTGMIELAESNDAQLRLLMAAIQGKK